MEAIKLLDYQQEAIDDPRKKIIYNLSCGAGKTYIIIAKLRQIGQPALLICIKQDKKKWLRIKERFGLDIEVMTKEEMKITNTHGKKKSYTNRCLNKYNVVVFDEIHKASMYTSGIFKALMWYVNIFKPEYILGATATPYSSTPWNVYTYMMLFGMRPNYAEWRKRFFIEIDIGGDRKILKENQKTMGEVQMLLKSLCFTKHVETGVTHEFWHSIPIDIPMMDNYGSIHDVSKVENKAQSVLDKLDELVEAGTVIVCYYQEEVEMLKKMYDCVAVSGKHPWKEEYADVEKYPIIVAQIDSMTAWEIPHHHKMIYYSRSWAYSSYEQSLGRIARANHFKNNYYHYLVPVYKDWNEDTVAQLVGRNLAKKQDFNGAKYEHPRVAQKKT